MKRALEIIAKVLGGIGLFLVVYVVYAHIASLATAVEYDSEPMVERFGSGVSFARMFEARAASGMRYEVKNGSLDVRAETGGSGELPRADFAGPVRRLEEIRLRLKIKAPVLGAVDASVGIETTGPNPRTLRAVFASGRGVPAYRLFGHADARSSQVTRESELARAGESSEISEGIRTLELRISPDLHQALVSVDDVPQASHFIDWPGGTPVRFVFGIAAREHGDLVGVELIEAAFEPMMHDTRELDFIDHLNGKFIDPRRWLVERAPREVADSSFKLTSGGLHVIAKAEGRVHHPEAIFGLRSPRMPFGSFRASTEVSVASMKRGAVYLAMGNLLPVPASRRVIVGVVADDEGVSRGFVLGHWTANGQLSFRHIGPIDKSDIHRIEAEYDVKTRRVRACVDGHCDLDEKLDLEPTEQVTFSVFTELNGEAGALDVILREVRFDRLGDSWN